MIPRILPLLGAGLLLSAAPVPLDAATLIEEPFSQSQPGSNTPAGWTATHSDNVDIASSSSVLRQRIWRSASQGGSSAIYYTGTQGEIVDGKMADFDLALTLRFGGSGTPSSSLRGVVFRTQTLDLSMPSGHDGFWGYSVGVITVGTSRGLYLHENPTGTTSSGFGTQLTFSTLSADLDNNVDYLLKVSAQGSQITASLETMSGTALTELSFDSAVVTEGYFGLRAAHANTAINTYFNNLSLQAAAIPEPSTAAASLLFGTVAGFHFLRRRTARKRGGASTVFF